MEETNFSTSLKAALESIKNIVDADTIIGEPITTPQGVVLIPVSKVMVGLATGGTDYIGKHTKSQSDKANSFAGYGGSGVTVSPVGFLVVKADGDVSMLSINNPQDAVNDIGSSVISLLDKTPTIIEKFKAIFKSKSSEETEFDTDVEELDLSGVIDTDSAE